VLFSAWEGNQSLKSRCIYIAQAFLSHFLYTILSHWNISDCIFSASPRLSAQTRQVQSLIIATTLPTRRITPRLQVKIIIPTRTIRTNKKVQLCQSLANHSPNPDIFQLTSPIRTPSRSNNRITLQRPRTPAARRTEAQWLVARGTASDIQIHA